MYSHLEPLKQKGHRGRRLRDQGSHGRGDETQREGLKQRQAPSCCALITSSRRARRDGDTQRRGDGCIEALGEERCRLSTLLLE